MDVKSYTFTWNGDSSANFGCYLIDYGGRSGWQTNSAGSNIEIIGDFVARRSKQYTYGVKQNEPQQFSVTIGHIEPKNRAEIDRILAWLIQPVEKDLIIDDNDMEFYRYTGFFTNPQIISAGREPFGLQLTFKNISPFAYTFPKEKQWNITRPEIILFNNDSSDFDYLYPEIEIVPVLGTQTFSIINAMDNNREFRFDFKSPYPDGKETIKIDNDLKIINSSMGNDYARRRFSQFNKKWLRFIRGQNKLNIVGNGKLTFRYVFARRIGS